MRKDWIGKTIEIRWGTSRGRDTYGYTTCTLSCDGRKLAGCNGGGYDMRGTVIGSWAAQAFAAELLKLKPEQMPANSHWQPERARVCDGRCKEQHEAVLMDAIAALPENASTAEAKLPELPKLPEDCFTCPVCDGNTRQSREGKRVDDGRYFYGLTFHNPNFDPGKALIGQDVSDRTLTKGDTGSAGKTVEQAERDGNSFGLERYQAFYHASCKHPTRVHRVPLIDGACGLSCVETILRAIGIQLRQVASTSKLDVYLVEACKRESMK